MDYLVYIEAPRNYFHTKIYNVTDLTDLYNQVEAEFWPNCAKIIWARPDVTYVTNPDDTWINENKGVYDYKAFTLGALAVDVNVGSTQSPLFTWVPVANYVEITTSANITIKFNSAADDWIPMTSTESPKRFNIRATNIFLSSVWWANVWILLQPK